MLVDGSFWVPLGDMREAVGVQLQTGGCEGGGCSSGQGVRPGLGSGVEGRERTVLGVVWKCLGVAQSPPSCPTGKCKPQVPAVGSVRMPARGRIPHPS